MNIYEKMIVLAIGKLKNMEKETEEKKTHTRTYCSKSLVSLLFSTSNASL